MVEHSHEGKSGGSLNTLQRTHQKLATWKMAAGAELTSCESNVVFVFVTNKQIYSCNLPPTTQNILLEQ